MTTVRTILAIVASQSWPLYQMDVKNAFPCRDLKEEVYMCLPQGVSSTSRNDIWWLRRSLYGLKKAPHAWFEKFCSALHLALIKALMIHFSSLTYIYWYQCFASLCWWYHYYGYGCQYDIASSNILSWLSYEGLGSTHSLPRLGGSLICWRLVHLSTQIYYWSHWNGKPPKFHTGGHTS